MILHVSSPDDPRVDAYRHVGDHQWLRTKDLFVAEGRLLLVRLVEAGYAAESVLVSPAALDALRSHIEALQCPVYVAAQDLLNGISGYNFHRGCLALARRPAPGDFGRFAQQHLVLGLERIGNPDNVGGLFRTGAALGVDGLLLDHGCADPFYRKALRTSMGAVLRVPFVVSDDWQDACGRLRRSGFTVVALTTGKDAVRLEQFAVEVTAGARLLVLVGAEGEGLSRRAREDADACVAIPMTDAVDSLNVTVAAGIALSRFAERLSGRTL